MKKLGSSVGLVVLSALGLFAVGCAADDTAQPLPPIDEVRSSLAREMSPQLTPDERTTFENGQAAFAVDILREVTKLDPNANVFLSPHSLSTALGMTYAGAKGQTAAEMKAALHYDLADDRLHPAFNSVDLALASRGQGQVAKDQKPFRLNLNNAMFGQKGEPFGASFLDTIATSYDAGVKTLDFSPATADQSRLAINGWVAERTEDRIKELLPKKSVDGAVWVLVNTVYFNASWAEVFDKNATQPRPFTKLDGSTVDVSTMSNLSSYPYVKGEGFEAVSLPYAGNELELLTILPDAGTFAKFESELTGKKVLDIMAGMETKVVALSFPKVKLESSPEIIKPLKNLGMKQAFDADADFSGIVDGTSITGIFHNTFLAIDEDGTEAAAATAVVGLRSSTGPDDFLTVKADRPFITAIVDKQTKTLVFVGRIVEPKSE